MTVDLATHLVADVTGMWAPCDCGADRDHDGPDIAPAERTPTRRRRDIAVQFPTSA